MSKIEKGLLHLSVLMNIALFVWIFIFGAAGVILKPNGLEIITNRGDHQVAIRLVVSEDWGMIDMYSGTKDGNVKGVLLRTSDHAANIDVLEYGDTKRGQDSKFISMRTSGGKYEDVNYEGPSIVSTVKTASNPNKSKLVELWPPSVKNSGIKIKNKS